jgi:hypothetical protein
MMIDKAIAVDESPAYTNILVFFNNEYQDREQDSTSFFEGIAMYGSPLE